MSREKIPPDGKKTWSNYYWFYYKWHMSIILMLIITIVVCTVQCASKKNPDYYIVFYSDAYVDSNVLDKVADKAEKYADDRNQDGEIYIQTINCSHAVADPSLTLTSNQQANAQLQSKNAIIWILDDAGVDQYYSENNLNVFGRSEALVSHDSHSLFIDDSVLSNTFKNAGYEEDYYIFFRYRDGDEEYNKIAEEMIKSLKK